MMLKKKVDEKIKLRESNYELMRILSMFFIVLYHVLIHGKIIEHATGSMEILVTLIETIILVHVNSFILITGFFQCKSRVKVRKILSIINQTWFYKVMMMVILIAVGLISSPPVVEILKTLFPLDYGTYWYIGCYLILYLISPILNKIINNSSKKELQKIIFLLFLIISISSTFSKDIFFNSFTGRSIGTFILLYMIGSYIRLYPIDQCYILARFTKSTKQLFYLFGFFFCVLLSLFCWITYNYFGNLGAITSEIGSIFGWAHISYASPIIILQSLCYFLFFGTISFKNQIINKISSCMLGIYLISENYYVRGILYEKIGITSIEVITAKTVLLVFLISIIIFVVSLIIEMLRKVLFKQIYNSKIAKKNRVWYQDYTKKLGLNINW